MCGILGGWGKADLGSLNAGLDEMIHRGPDSDGIWFESFGAPVFLGMRRLSIIDLEGGDQPLFNENKNIVTICNGEIYNYKELIDELEALGHVFRCRSDAESILHLYEEDSYGFVRRLRGMFGFALMDRRQRRLVLGRDRFGKKPLYYCQPSPDSLYFASELRALRKLLQGVGLWTNEFDPQAISDYLSLSSIPQPRTIYRGISMLPPGSCLRFDGEQLKIESYWDPKLNESFSGTYEEAQEEVRQLLKESVRIRLRSDVPVGVFLSGGIDSTLVAHEAAKEIGSELHTFTLGTNNHELDESGIAKRTAERLGIRNEILNIDMRPGELIDKVVHHYGQPFSDASAIPSLALSAAAAKKVKVVLNGDGGDEVFAGYRRYIAAKNLDLLQLMPTAFWGKLGLLMGRLPLRRRSPLGLMRRAIQGAGCGWGGRYLHWTSDMFNEEDKSKYFLGEKQQSTESWIESISPELKDPVRSMLQADTRIIFLSGLLVKMDMATMAYSLEGRSPLLDSELVEFAMTLPSKMLVKGKTGKRVLRDAYREQISAEVFAGKKRGFEIPLVHWLQGPLKERVHDLLGSPQARVHAYMDGAFLKRLILGNEMTDRNWGYIVYALLVLEMWLLKNK